MCIQLCIYVGEEHARIKQGNNLVIIILSEDEPSKVLRVPSRSLLALMTCQCLFISLSVSSLVSNSFTQLALNLDDTHTPCTYIFTCIHDNQQHTYNNLCGTIMYIWGGEVAYLQINQRSGDPWFLTSSPLVATLRSCRCFPLLALCLLLLLPSGTRNQSPRSCFPATVSRQQD